MNNCFQTLAAVYSYCPLNSINWFLKYKKQNWSLLNLKRKLLAWYLCHFKISLYLQCIELCLKKVSLKIVVSPFIQPFLYHFLWTLEIYKGYRGPPTSQHFSETNKTVADRNLIRWLSKFHKHGYISLVSAGWQGNVLCNDYVIMSFLSHLLSGKEL